MIGKILDFIGLSLFYIVMVIAILGSTFSIAMMIYSLFL